MINVPETAPRRTDRKTCPSCEATTAGCRGHKFLSGRFCCEQCCGDHDLPVSRERHPERAMAMRTTGPKAASEVSSPAQTSLRDTGTHPSTKEQS